MTPTEQSAFDAMREALEYHIEQTRPIQRSIDALAAAKEVQADIPKIGCPLPCPFCGHVGLDFHEGTTFRWLAAECGKCGATCGEVRIQTLGKGTAEEWRAAAEQSAIDAWNTRAAQPT